MADDVVTPEPEPVVVTVDGALDDLTAKVDAVEKVNADLKQKVADLQSQLDGHVNNGSLTDAQLKKLQDATARLSKLVS
jgi:cell division septum initiation protein DivIVA